VGDERALAAPVAAGPRLACPPTSGQTAQEEKLTRKIVVAIGVAGIAAIGAGASFATASSVKVENAKCDVGVLLPDTKSSARWETQDRPDLQKAITAVGLKPCITNAEGSAQTQRNQADQAITNGAKVLLLVNLDSGSGAAIASSAKAKGVKTIDYDRLTLKGTSSYYVSFNNVTVGKLQGQGLVNCLKASGQYSKHPVIAELNGSPTDNNATLFAQGYNSVLNPLYKNGTFKKGPNQSVPNWNPAQGLTIFEQMLQQTGNKINGVAAANDALGNAVISAIKSRNLPKIPVTGQDATAQGVQNIISGYQCMTVLKDIKKEATAAAALAKSLISGGKAVGINNSVSDGKRNVPSVLLTPVSITKTNYKLLFTLPAPNGTFLKRSQVCSGSFAKFCK
jgi:D-xylose transport system substrate-binding protein